MQTTFMGISILILLIMPVISVQASQFNYTNSTNISEIYNGPTYQSVKANIHGFLLAKQMADNATRFETADSTKYKEFYHEFIKSHPFPDLNSSSSWAIEKIQLAKQQSGYALWDHKTHYDIDVQYQKIDILKQLHEFLADGRNGVPAFDPCVAFHNCITKPFIPIVTERQQHEVFTNSTLENYSLPLKPEFQNNPTGYITSPSWVKNMTDLQKFMTNSTK